MKGFIEVTVDFFEYPELINSPSFEKKVLINVEHVERIVSIEDGTKTIIRLVGDHSGYIIANESYDEVKKMIEEALE